MSTNILIGDVSIPLGDFAVAGTAWLGIKKAGKTYGAKGVAEQLISHGVPNFRYLKFALANTQKLSPRISLRKRPITNQPA